MAGLNDPNAVPLHKRPRREMVRRVLFEGGGLVLLVLFAIWSML